MLCWRGREADRQNERERVKEREGGRDGCHVVDEPPGPSICTPSSCPRPRLSLPLNLIMLQELRLMITIYSSLIAAGAEHVMTSACSGCTRRACVK